MSTGVHKIHMIQQDLCFLGSETKIMINLEHVIVQSVVSLFFPVKF